LAFPIEGRTGAKWLVTGRPVPRGTEGGDRIAARARLGVPEAGECLLVFGGSLGARRLNEAAVEAFGAAAPCSVVHAAGRRDYDDLRARLAELGSPAHYRLFPYIEPFADALAASGLPSILVPYPHATGNHQDANARFMEQAGAAVVIPDSELDGPRLARE